jgi:hypothetical protein
MAHIEKLKLTTETRNAGGDETKALRQKVINHLTEQKALAEADLKGEAYVPKRTAYLKDEETGQRVPKEVPKRPRRWFWHNLEGKWFLELRYGNKPLSIDGRNTAIEVGAKEKLPEVIQTLIEATKKGELDNVLKAAQQALQRKK